MKVIMATSKETASDFTGWWGNLSREQQEQYKKLHPNSKYAKHFSGNASNSIESQRAAAANHLKQLHSSLDTVKALRNGPKLHEHLQKVSKALEGMAQAHSQGKPAGMKHMGVFNNPPRAEYTSKGPHDLASALTKHAKKHLKLAYKQLQGDDPEDDDTAALYAGDAGHHLKLGHHIQNHEDKKAVKHLDKVADSDFGENLPSSVLRHLHKHGAESEGDGPGTDSYYD